MTTLDSVDDTSNKVSEKMDSNDNQQEQQQNGQTENGEKDADNQDNANEEDYIGLDVVDTWDDDEKDRPRRRSWDRTRGRDKRNSREQERDRDRERERERDRDRDRGRRRSRSYDRRRSRSCDRKRDSNRRDPNKSSKDIEQDKMRTKKDNDSKMLAEKEKAIKNLLDSDEVVPPGTETEAIENMVDKTKQDEDKGKEEEKARRDSQENRKSRDERRRSPIHNRLGRRIISPRRSPRRSPGRYSPDRRRKKTPINYSPEDRRRRSSYDRQTSVERREASRRRLRERLAREGRRSRSRDRRSLERHRSRSFDRHRRLSRSPFDRRRRRSLSRTPTRSPSRRKRSPFLNEIARQFQGDTLPPLQPPIGPIPHGMGPVGPMYMPPGIVPGPGGILPPPQGPIMPGPPNIGPGHAEMDHPWQQWSLHNYEGCPPGINFDPLNRAPTDYPNPGMYNAPIPHHMRPPSPQPVPAPGQAPPAPMIFSSVPLGPVQPPLQVPGPKYSPNEAFGIISKADMLADHRSRAKREGRMKTPEPPIISDIKQHEKTSLSSLLEASVSSKDSSSMTASFKGFRPEIIRNCERALRSLPAEDPRLKMKGRFFFDPMKKDNEKDKKEIASNSILLRKGRTEIHWDEEENQISSTQQPPVRKRVVTHQKICQTDETTKESIGLQAEPERADFWMQVSPLDLMPKEERRQPLDDMRRIPMDERRNPIDDRRGPMDDRRGPIDDRRGLVDDRRGLMDERARLMDENRRPLTDRLDWSMRETYDHSSKLRDNMDLRWSLSNSQNSRQQQNSNLWTRSFSPNRQQMPNDILHRSGMPMSNMDNIPRVGMDRMMDSRDRMMDSRDRLMDPRDREMDIRDREVDMRDVRALDSMRDRDRLTDTREGMMMGGGAGLMVGPTGFRDPMINDTFSRQPKNVDDYELRKNPFSRGNLDREIPSRDPDHESPVPLEEDNEELEIIEERGFDRDQQWQRNNATSLAALNNARGAAAIRGGGALPAANRSFRGRAVGFRAKY